MSARKKIRTAVFASGGGSNFGSLIVAAAEDELDLDLAVCISNNSSAGALERARSAGIEAKHLSHKMFPDAAAFDAALLAFLAERNIELLALAGYMKKLGDSVIETYSGRITNIHPALLPSFGGQGMYGIHVHEAVLAAGCKVTGVTVHLVNNKYDSGPIIAQRAVPVEEGDTPETLQKRVLAIEHQIYPAVLQLYCEGRLIVDGNIVRIKSV